MPNEEPTGIQNKFSDDHYTYIGKLPRIKEKIFVEQFLPVLSRNNTEELNAVYIPAIGKATARAEVVDENDKVLFIVPPVSYPIVSVSEGKFCAALKLIRQQMEIHEGSGTAKLRTFLTNNVKNAPIPQQDVEQWRMIFSRYGMLNSDSVASSACAVNAKAQHNDDEDDGEW